MKANRLPQRVDVKGFEGLYYATPSGKIYRYPKPPQPIRVRFGKNRAATVSLYKDGKRHDIHVKKIMKECFFPEGVDELRSINEKDDLSYWNLKPIKHGEKRHGGSTQDRPVVRIMGDDVRFYRSIDACSRENYVSHKSIRNYCQKHSKKTCDGATYMFEEEYMSKYGDEYEVSCD